MDSRTMIIASHNQGKIKEFKELFEPKGYTVKSLIDMQDDSEPEETGTTFAANAVIKAQAVTDTYGVIAVADDSGLEIDAFDGKPGVYSARWLGHDTPYDTKNAYILNEMKDTTNRGCRYVCAIAITAKGRKPVVFEDTVECEIAREAKGDNGFGYDPIMYYPPYGKTMAQMSDEEKNGISHRGKAVRKLMAWLEENDEIQ